MLINNKWKNSAKNTEAYNLFASAYSDHRIVTTRIRLSLRSNKTKTQSVPQYDWSSLKNDPDVRDQYITTVRNRFEALSTESTQRCCLTIHLIEIENEEKSVMGN